MQKNYLVFCIWYVSGLFSLLENVGRPMLVGLIIFVNLKCPLANINNFCIALIFLSEWVRPWTDQFRSKKNKKNKNLKKTNETNKNYFYVTGMNLRKFRWTFEFPHSSAPHAHTLIARSYATQLYSHTLHSDVACSHFAYAGDGLEDSGKRVHSAANEIGPHDCVMPFCLLCLWAMCSFLQYFLPELRNVSNCRSSSNSLSISDKKKEANTDMFSPALFTQLKQRAVRTRTTG